jgi:hypothetical protein
MKALAGLLLVVSGVAVACGTVAAPAATVRPPATLAIPTPGRPEWFGVQRTDVTTGQSFNINDSSEKVVLVETMARWRPTCLFQAAHVRNLHKLLGN